jgi:hypothetical protein
MTDEVPDDAKSIWDRLRKIDELVDEAVCLPHHSREEVLQNIAKTREALELLARVKMELQ